MPASFSRRASKASQCRRYQVRIRIPIRKGSLHWAERPLSLNTKELDWVFMQVRLLIRGRMHIKLYPNSGHHPDSHRMKPFGWSTFPPQSPNFGSDFYCSKLQSQFRFHTEENSPWRLTDWAKLRWCKLQRPHEDLLTWLLTLISYPQKSLFTVSWILQHRGGFICIPRNGLNEMSSALGGSLCWL